MYLIKLTHRVHFITEIDQILYVEREQIQDFLTCVLAGDGGFQINRAQLMLLKQIVLVMCI